MPLGIIHYLPLLLATLFITSLSDNSSQCHTSTYTSSFTRCQLTFLNCFTYTKLTQCLKKRCQRYIRAGQCRLETSFILEQQQCYRSCCGSYFFDQAICNTHNQSLQAREETANSSLTAILITVVIILVVVVGAFVVQKMGCCEKRDPLILLRYNIKWRKDEYQEAKCDHCHTYGPTMLTPCQHVFHLSCFQKAAGKMVCPTCSKPILGRVKIYCSMCRQKSFKVKLNKVSEIDQVMEQGKALHIDECPRQIKTNETLVKEQL